ncbi:hypothetical protein ACFOYU_21230 [Microvirga sp. GCM10011540]|uniref:hypothetical protein n=1 Tax=Microvirga sp. GCM10011540 TaxID=3317338 RepID=UPI0036164FED
MVRRDSIHEELGALQADLARRSPSAQDGAAPRSAETNIGAAGPDGLEEQLRELGQALSGLAENTEDAIAEHPIAAVLAAFVLGVAVGRLLGRG